MILFDCRCLLRQLLTAIAARAQGNQFLAGWLHSSKPLTCTILSRASWAIARESTRRTPSDHGNAREGERSAPITNANEDENDQRRPLTDDDWPDHPRSSQGSNYLKLQQNMGPSDDEWLSQLHEQLERSPVYGKLTP